MDQLSIVGGGIGGLAAALSLGRLGSTSQLLEQADLFLEVGAGIGLGPNALRRLQTWGLDKPLRDRGFIPSGLEVRSAQDGQLLGSLLMAEQFERRYGAPYMTIHRADLHKVLLDAVQAQGMSDLQLSKRLTAIDNTDAGVQLTLLNADQSHTSLQSSVLIASDGVNSEVRRQLWGSAGLQASGHWAYRTLLPRHTLPAAWRGDAMGLWLGPRLHLVHYPVRGGEWLNVVVLVETDDVAQTPGWDSQRSAAQTAHDLQTALQGSCSHLQDLVRMSESWRAWALFDRHPVQSADDMAQGRLALLGDAAHPMLPYLAQGAGMAIEDADTLAQCWLQAGLSVEQRLQAYAQARWQRVAKVQARARRNARMFHASGALAWGRDLAMHWGGAAVMDMPWLYGG
jgi:salicylate hydroxylase